MRGGIVRPFSPDEKRYIMDNAPYRDTWGRLAKELDRKFPGPVGETRSSKGVRNWYRQELHKSKDLVRISADVPPELAADIQTKGLSPDEVGKILMDGLRREMIA